MKYDPLQSSAKSPIANRQTL